MVKILDITLYDKDITSAVDDVLKTVDASDKLNRCISATGAHGIVYAARHKAFKTVLSNFYLNLPDGMPCVWIGRLKGASLMKRCYGPQFFRELMLASANKSVKHFFCGGKEGVAEELKRQCEHKFGNSNIVGIFCPPFRKMMELEMEDLGEQINMSKADIVWIGLSTPKQEEFATDLTKYIKTHFIVTVGAAFDFHTDRVKQAPTWLQNLGMEWFFRLLIEPKRLYKRYLEIVPLFIFYNLREFFNYCLGKKYKIKY